MKANLSATISVCCLLCTFSAISFAQEQAQAPVSGQPVQIAGSTVPHLVGFSGVLKDAAGKPVTGPVSITFSLFAEQEGGPPLWTETQIAEVDAQGNYTVHLGATNPVGLPLDLFTTGAARWLAVQPEIPGIGEPSRILLVGVPYALKAADADTLGGKPASAFLTQDALSVLTGSSSSAASPANAASTAAPELQATTSGTVAGSGTTNYLPVWTSSTNIGSSALYQSAGGLIGLGTKSPGANLDIETANATGFSLRVGNLATLTSAGLPGGEYLQNDITNNGATTGSEVDGIDMVMRYRGTASLNAGNMRDVNGVYFAGFNYNTGTTSWINGLYGDIRNLGTSGTYGNVANMAAIHIKAPQISGGAVTNLYGLYIEGISGGTNNYSFYSPSGTGYFGGNVGIGTATPAAKLEVNGTAKFDGAVTFAGGETYTGNVTTNDQLVSTVASGTAPLSVKSTTQVANLNASLLGGLSASAFATKGANAFTGTQTIGGSLNLTGSINSALVLQGNVTDPTTGNNSANVIGGNSINKVTNGATGATVGGGGFLQQGLDQPYPYPNTVSDDFGPIGGGVGNTAGAGNGNGGYATVAGGVSNIASGDASTVAGGGSNTASGGASIVAGGQGNLASGDNSVVPGGSGNTASGNFSFAGGLYAEANDQGSFVWCQENGTACSSKGADSFVVGAYGGVYLYSGPGGQGCILSSNSGSWTCSSDRNLKNNIVSIDPRSVLERVAQMPISQWSMKADAAGHKHIGPMAQDFYAAFGLGDTDKYIAQGDAQGVALASVQGLYRMVQEKDERIRKLEAQLQALEERMARFEASGGSTLSILNPQKLP